MALRYSADDLLHLRASPLCAKPDRLPPAEEWMGAPLEQIRTQNKANASDRPRTGDNPLHDHTNRRPGYERHATRNSANPEDFVLAPPRMAFASARGAKPHEHDGEGLREPDSHDRFGRNIALRRRNDADQDSDGWTPVKPRKSFGADGAERFAGRMGSFRDEKRPQRDREDRDATRDRPMRNFDALSRDRAIDEDGRPRNGLGRNKSEAWAGKPEPENAVPDKRERIDRAKSWRDRDPVIEDDRRNKQKERRWGRDNDNYRNEQEPEWFDEPVEPKHEKRTQQDFQKWMEEMKKAKNSVAVAEQQPTSAAAEAATEAHKPPAQSAPAVETGPDKFFLNFGGSSALDTASPASEQPGQAPKSKGPGKSSRFTSFFNAPQSAVSPTPPSEVPHARPEPSNPVAAFSMGVLAGAMPLSGGPSPSNTQGQQGAEEERQAFQQLIMKLHKQSATATPPGLSPFAAPAQQQPQHPSQQLQEYSHAQHGSHPGSKQGSIASPEVLQPYGAVAERRDGPLGPPPPANLLDMISPPPVQSQAQSQAAYSNQLMQDIMGHHRRLSSQTSQRADPSNVSRNNSNTEFLMNLMRTTPSSQTPQQHNLPLGQPPKQGPMPQHHEREPDYARDSRASQRSSRPQQPPGFGMDEPFHHPDSEQRPNHPTQILQRPGPPPGLDQMGHNWMPGGNQMPPPPPQQRGGPMGPPPGLAGGPSRNMPMQHMFPPSFPPGGMPPPEAIGGMPPPRNMPPPPPGFFNGPPPPGYLPPGMDGFNGLPPGMEFMGSPFEGGRGLPPPGNGGRGAFGR
ncbi:hypothetical protein NLU13_0972 [Sarocladium strictum]|uniref:Uncharacterized protein n=1 Tax=Sarocladium strictum TaxID=5046 RepID=A0AA39LBB1_SARSR|nr:hypothetical protein NLU13_0972 [Sarocladium strictum]